MTTEATCVQLLSGFDWEHDSRRKKKEKLQSIVLKIAEFQSLLSLLGSH